MEECLSKSKARKFVGHKNQYVNGQKFATVICVLVPIRTYACVCVCVCICDTVET